MGIHDKTPTDVGLELRKLGVLATTVVQRMSGREVTTLVLDRLDEDTEDGGLIKILHWISREIQDGATVELHPTGLSEELVSVAIEVEGDRRDVRD